MISILLSIIIVVLVIFIFVRTNKLQRSDVNLKNARNTTNINTSTNSTPKLDALYTNLTNAKLNATYASNTADNIMEFHNTGIPISESDIIAFRKYIERTNSIIAIIKNRTIHISRRKFHTE